MRTLRNKVIITFPSTVAAMAMEKAAQTAGTPGRLIPVPSSISAGCGMCWCAEPEQEEACAALLQNQKLLFEHLYHI